ncbi:hypothetical protein BDQ17DRAFT_1393008 [Cyathus striatus]|nr:hypothetical protein BDQ17DRAFT_1393008 [Cyathus striatus]
MPYIGCDLLTNSESESHSKQASVEEVEDMGEEYEGHEEYEGNKGEREEESWYIQDFPSMKNAGVPTQQSPTKFEQLQDMKKAASNGPWCPFTGEADWELGCWLMGSGVSQTKIEEFLKLEAICNGAWPSFHTLLSHIRGESATLTPPIDSLPHGPEWSYKTFKLIGYELDHKENSMEETVTLWKRDPVEYWWWEMQESLPNGATIIPVILSSDKTNLSQFSGDKVAWPPLVEAGKKGIDMVCVDGFIWIIYAILTAYIADYPEKCLIEFCQENSCPQCLVKPEEHGHGWAHANWQVPISILVLLEEKLAGIQNNKFASQYLHPINPFWRDLPGCDIFSCIMPDIFQLHKGIFKDHIVSWASRENIREVDDRFKAMTTHPTLQHFKRGISLTSQWTRTEHKNMEKVFLGVVAGVTNWHVQKTVKAVLDFIYYAHFEIHSTTSPDALDATWEAIHVNKEVFVDLGICEHFNISKLHNIKYYCTANGYNTEGTEHLHIDLAKSGWLQHQESIHCFGMYLQWAAPGYVMNMSGGDEAITNDDENSDHKVISDEVMKINESYSIAKSTPFLLVTVHDIINHYGAANFLYYLEDFVQKDVNPHAHISFDEKTLFPIYKLIDVIHTTLPQTQRLTETGLKEATNGWFRLRATQVRLIFKLPKEHGSYSHLLAYVNLFKLFQEDPVSNLSMFQVSLSTNTHVQHAIIIPISEIV